MHCPLVVIRGHRPVFTVGVNAQGVLQTGPALGPCMIDGADLRSRFSPDHMAIAVTCRSKPV